MVAAGIEFVDVRLGDGGGDHGEGGEEKSAGDSL